MKKVKFELTEEEAYSVIGGLKLLGQDELHDKLVKSLLEQLKDSFKE